MTIRQKVMKAWAESWRVVSVTEKNAEPVRGKIITFNPGDNSFCLLKDDSEKRIYRIADLIDIGFPLDEEAAKLRDICVAGGDDRSYPHCDVAECLDRQGGFFRCKNRQCDTRMVFVDYAGVFREDPKPGEDENPILVELGLAFEDRKRVTVTYLGTTEEHEYMGYVKQINTVMARTGSGIEHIISFGDKAVGPTMYLSAIKEVLVLAEPPADDEAPEQWVATKYRIVQRRDCKPFCKPLFERRDATDAQADLAAAAPDMLDVLSELEKHISDAEGVYPPDKMSLMLDKALFQRVHDAVAKARGEEGK